VDRRAAVEHGFAEHQPVGGGALTWLSA
jgi:hypothetical protein